MRYHRLSAIAGVGGLLSLIAWVASLAGIGAFEFATGKFWREHGAALAFFGAFAATVLCVALCLGAEIMARVKETETRQL